MIMTTREADGIDRPTLALESTFRPTVRYRDFRRAIAGGRLYRVDVTDGDAPGPLGWLYVSDEGWLAASPGRTDGGSVRMRWVGGFETRSEVVAYLRGRRGEDVRS